MKKKQIISTLAAAMLAVSLFTCTAFAANESVVGGETAATEQVVENEQTPTAEKKSLLDKYMDFVTSPAVEFGVVLICAGGIYALTKFGGVKMGKKKSGKKNGNSSSSTRTEGLD